MEELKDFQSSSSRSSDAEEYFLPPSPRRRSRKTSRFQYLNPARVLANAFSYHRPPSLPTDSADSSAATHHYPANRVPSRGSFADRRDSRLRWSCGKLSRTKVIALAIAGFVFVALLRGGSTRRDDPVVPEENVVNGYDWMHFQKLGGCFNGIRTLVPFSEYIADNGYNLSDPLRSAELAQDVEKPPLDPKPFVPYPGSRNLRESSRKSSPAVQRCYLDDAKSIPAPDIFAYSGLPQHSSEPFFGSYEELGLDGTKCFDRYGRLGPYGYGSNASFSGLDLANVSERAGSEGMFQQMEIVNYTHVDWGSAQRRCYESNKARFGGTTSGGVASIKRQAYVLRTWTGYQYSDHQILTMRAMINELSLRSSGEYDVYLLIHVKDDSIPIWANEEIYNRTIEENVPREFWNISTLWSERLMRTYYPGKFDGNFATMSSDTIHGVYRSAHFALQWFSQQHPEYDHFWNWEMDLRYTGHYWEFHDSLHQWTKRQPRKGLWERNQRFWIPKYHGDYQNFTKFVEHETAAKDITANDEQQSGPTPVWGPVNAFPNSGMLPSLSFTTPPTSYEQDNYTWGVGEDADLITFNPIFDPSTTNWVFRTDASGYNTSLPIPPRRAAVITVARLSKRLLDTMHEETWRLEHTMFPEMWPPTVAFHHGLKAVYVPHPVYFDHDWNLQHMDQAFNYPGSPHASPFGWGEHNFFGGSFYYVTSYSAQLWRRWLGQVEDGAGGRTAEEAGTGRMCLRSMLHHPIKHEASPVE